MNVNSIISRLSARTYDIKIIILRTYKIFLPYRIILFYDLVDFHRTTGSWTVVALHRFNFFCSLMQFVESPLEFPVQGI